MSKRWLIVGAALAGLFTAGLAPVQAAAEPTAPQAAAAPARNNSIDEPVYFLKGYSKGDPPGVNCGNYWGPALKFFKVEGWRGPRHTVAFYANDRNCSIRIARGSTATSIRELGRRLAWDIHRRYSTQGKSVDLIGHSMGGLIARAALTGVQKQLPGWPPYIYVEDVATLGAPHDGMALGYFCLAAQLSRQCKEMRPGSGFLDWTDENPQSAQGTDWTLIGADDDGVVGWSALRMRAGHRVWYTGNNAGWSHGALNDITTGTYAMIYENPPEVAQEKKEGAAPVRAAMNSLYWWKNW
ncbi:hypothetical protein G6045_16290 [Streptomyces sp. YC504]|uniref:GPI inositol-deacylase PGAP1-like alpha/beta domain-containing protein n=1 Tax=Streptomyces mesophilus TaxID=1775132 RepID=A0A6G4XK57_9ACTN|nr:hypothetical protein [Streptomyces mesophilus]NGO77207.1 hypothetical protein [Streptomyces mesophilus]